MLIHLVEQWDQNTKNASETASKVQDIGLVSCLADRAQVEEDVLWAANLKKQ